MVKVDARKASPEGAAGNSQGREPLVNDPHHHEPRRGGRMLPLNVGRSAIPYAPTSAGSSFTPTCAAASVEGSTSATDTVTAPGVGASFSAITSRASAR